VSRVRCWHVGWCCRAAKRDDHDDFSIAVRPASSSGTKRHWWAAATVAAVSDSGPRSTSNGVDLTA